MFHLIALTPSLLFQEQHMTKPLHPAWSLESGFPLSSSRHSRCWCYSASEERPMRGATKPLAGRKNVGDVVQHCSSRIRSEKRLDCGRRSDARGLGCGCVGLPL